MGRQLTELQMDKKTPIKSNGLVHVAPRIAVDDIEVTDYEVKECTEEKNAGQDLYEHQYVSSDTDHTVAKVGVKIVGGYQNSSSPGLKSPGVGAINYTVPKPFTLKTEKRGCVAHTTGADTEGSGMKCSPKAISVRSPSSVKSFQTNSPVLSRNLSLSDDKKRHENDDCWSLTSSADASGLTNKSRATVASAPIFKCTERIEKRKEFYSKLEEKHRALEEERKEYEARVKEEQEAALKLLRKNMTYKANPVPDFYRQGPPLKPELKKLPVTRAKSPNLTRSRRRSCSDVVASSIEEKTKAPSRAARHSVGAYKQGSPHVKAPSPTPSTRKIQGNERISLNGTPKSKEAPQHGKEAPNSAPPKLEEQTSNQDLVEA